MRIFWKKSCKIAAASGALLSSPIGLRRLGALPPHPRVVILPT